MFTNYLTNFLLFLESVEFEGYLASFDLILIGLIIYLFTTGGSFTLSSYELTS